MNAITTIIPRRQFDSDEPMPQASVDSTAGEYASKLASVAMFRSQRVINRYLSFLRGEPLPETNRRSKDIERQTALHLLAAGHPIADVAREVGVGYTTVKYWKEHAK